ncbi:MAG TPA: hypothetical protein VFP84_26285 [Kofleriaceae bacterium]|nr:hypothetical protein [Kofleriaceae bacterium]
MSPTKLSRFVVAAALVGGFMGAVANAAPQTHHCKMPDGTMDMKKTHKQCTAAKGTWFKDVQTPAPTTPAPTPAPAPAPTTPAPAK